MNIKNEYLSTSYKGVNIEVTYDSNACDPYVDSDCMIPAMYYSGGWHGRINDYSNGDIYCFVVDFLTDNQIIQHQKRIFCVIEDMYSKDDLQEYLNRDEKAQSIRDMISDYIQDSIGNMVKFCREFKIKHYFTTSRGYIQGDWADFFACWTPEYEKITGVSYNKITEADFERDEKLWSSWAWGDTYCVECEEIDDTNLGGFCGDDDVNSYIEDEVKPMIDKQINLDIATYVAKAKTLIKNNVPLYERKNLLDKVKDSLITPARVLLK